MQTLEMTEIEIPYPEVGEPQLRIVMGAGRVRLTPEQSEVWTRGTYHDPSGWLPCHVVQRGPAVEIVQNWQHHSEFHDLFPGAPELDLALGTGRAYPLNLELGATDTHADLGGVPIPRFSLKQGAGTIHLDFSAPNPQAMSTMVVGAGAGSIDLRNLANANCAELTVEGGAAGYKLDFSGVLRRNTTVRVMGGMCAVEITVPAGLAAQITTESLLGAAAADADFTRRDGAFWTPAALAGGTPRLAIAVNVALGSIRLLTV